MKQNKIFFNYCKPFKQFVWGGTFLTFVSVLLILVLAQITQLFIDSMFATNLVPTANFGVLWGWITNSASSLETLILWLCISFIVVAILKAFSSFGASQCFYKLATRSRSKLRKDCFTKLSFMTQRPTARKTFFNLTSDITDYADALYTHIPKMTDSFARIFLASLFCLLLDPMIALSFLIFLPVLLIFGLGLKKVFVPLFEKARTQKSTLFVESENLISAIRVIKIFGAENWANQKHHEVNALHTEAVTKAYCTVNRYKILLNILRGAGILCAFSVSAYAALNNLISIGCFVLFMTYAVIIFDAGVNFLNSFFEYKASLVGALRLEKFLGADSVKTNFKNLNGNEDIEIKNVCLSVQNQKIFENLNLSFPFGSHTVVFLKSGQGKTALARLILRFNQPSCGKVLFNGTEIQEFDVASLRKNFSYVSQEIAIFEGTIEDNITMFSPRSEEKLLKTIKACGLENFVNSFEKKHHHLLAEGGKNLTSQHKQKIAIARAYFRDAPVLLLDSAFSKLPPLEAEEVLKNLKTAWKGRTMIVLTENPLISQHFTRVFKPKGGAK